MRFEKLALRLQPQPIESESGAIAIIRQRSEETVEQAFLRHYAERPGDAASCQTVFLYAWTALVR